MDNLVKRIIVKGYFISTFLVITTILNAASIKGHVNDAETHKAIPGAVISISGTNLNEVADTRGSFSFNNLKPGNYTLVGSCMGYKNSTSQNINLTTTDANIIVDLNMEPSLIKMNEVVIQ